MGLELPENYVRAKFGIPAVAEGDKILKRAESAEMSLGGAGLPFANEVSDALTQAATRLNLRESERAQYSGVEEFLARLEAAETEEEFTRLLEEFKRRFPALAENVLSRDDVAEALEESLKIKA
jgi:phage gp29-like protein